jgi:tRNA U34 5-methylaminomethyl-2-thiouridine-forming methyltransferase MnmC
VRRALQAAGFQVEKLPGPPPKREITRAFRPGIVSA